MPGTAIMYVEMIRYVFLIVPLELKMSCILSHSLYHVTSSKVDDYLDNPVGSSARQRAVVIGL